MSETVSTLARRQTIGCSVPFLRYDESVALCRKCSRDYDDWSDMQTRPSGNHGSNSSAEQTASVLRDAFEYVLSFFTGVGRFFTSVVVDVYSTFLQPPTEFVARVTGLDEILSRWSGTTKPVRRYSGMVRPATLRENATAGWCASAFARVSA